MRKPHRPGARQRPVRPDLDAERGDVAACSPERERRAAEALGCARLLVSGSAPLPVREFERIRDATGPCLVERYGLTETLMNCAVPADGARRLAPRAGPFIGMWGIRSRSLASSRVGTRT